MCVFISQFDALYNYRVNEAVFVGGYGQQSFLDSDWLCENSNCATSDEVELLIKSTKYFL